MRYLGNHCNDFETIVLIDTVHVFLTKSFSVNLNMKPNLHKCFYLNLHWLIDPILLASMKYHIYRQDFVLWDSDHHDEKSNRK